MWLVSTVHIVAKLSHETGVKISYASDITYLIVPCYKSFNGDACSFRTREYCDFISSEGSAE